MKTHLPSTLKRARALRRQMSLPEVLLWMQLQARPSGHKFRKQHPFGPFVADFYCDDAKLVVEVDRESHNRGDQPEFDAQRDAFFASHGLRTLRILARDVLSNMDIAIQHIVSVANTTDTLFTAQFIQNDDTGCLEGRAPSPSGRGFALEQYR